MKSALKPAFDMGEASNSCIFSSSEDRSPEASRLRAAFHRIWVLKGSPMPTSSFRLPNPAMTSRLPAWSTYGHLSKLSKVNPVSPDSPDMSVKALQSDKLREFNSVSPDSFDTSVKASQLSRLREVNPVSPDSTDTSVKAGHQNKLREVNPVSPDSPDTSVKALQ